MRRIAAALLGAALMALALWHLTGATRGLEVSRTQVGTTPVTVFSRPGVEAAPVVVIAHGFAGSQQLMLPFATTLARSGYTAVTFDALGHGRNPAPLSGDVSSADGATAALLGQIAEVAAFARALPRSDGRLALLGHSMSSDIVVRAAIADPGIAATIAVSLFSREVTGDAPRNLLVITGAWEPGLREEALRVAALAPGGTAAPFVTSGDPAAGSGRRAALAPNVEHVGVLYSPVSLAEARDWLNAVFSRAGTGPLDTRGPWIGAWFAGVLALAWGLAPQLPRVATAAARARGGWRRLLVAGLGPALLTPLLAWKLPEGLLPVPVADYLSLHFLIYGLLTALALRLTPAPPRPGHASPGRLALATLAYASFALLVIYLPIDRFVASFNPPAGRLPLLLTLLAGLLPYFVADEMLTRGPGAPRGAYAFTKLAFLASIAIAIALNPERLFFLILIVPVMLLFFMIFGLFSRWCYQATGHPLPAALANALLFAWAIAVTFPILQS